MKNNRDFLVMKEKYNKNVVTIIAVTLYSVGSLIKGAINKRDTNV